jgi:hypothetical protein
VRSVPEGRDRQCAKADSSGGGAGGARSEGDEVSGKGERAVGSERGRQRVRDGGERDGGSPAALKTRAQHFSALHPEGKREYTPQRAAEGKSDGLAQRHGVQFMARTRRRASRLRRGKEGSRGTTKGGLSREAVPGHLNQGRPVGIDAQRLGTTEHKQRVPEQPL